MSEDIDSEDITQKDLAELLKHEWWIGFNTGWVLMLIIGIIVDILF